MCDTRSGWNMQPTIDLPWGKESESFMTHCFTGFDVHILVVPYLIYC